MFFPFLSWALLGRPQRQLVLSMGLLVVACQRPAYDVQLPETPSTSIPVRRVVLYQNGVGYFERAGEVDDNVLSIRARPSQINDLLKSLTVIDTGSGRAVSVSLPLDKSADRILSELPEQVRHASGLLDVLTVFRGAHVEVDGRLGSVSGRVVGVENLNPPAADADGPLKADWRVTIRSDRGQLRVYPLLDIRSVTLRDPALIIGLEQALDASLNAGDWKPLTVTIRLSGKDTHRLLASYVIEMPRWKPAYRIVLSQEQALLQGWAVVDNVSGEDWRDVQLSLVAGAPLSFTYDLHSPQFVHRVDLTPRGLPTAAPPPMDEGGTESVTHDARAADAEVPSVGTRAGRGVAAARKSRAPAPMPAAPSGPPDTIDLGREMLEAERVEAHAEDLGALFRYDIADPVTIPDRSSTLVSIINRPIQASEVVLFRSESSHRIQDAHPYRAVKLTNDTPFTLETGPVTVYAQGTFVGEGFIERVQPKATHFVSYAKDAKVSLNSDHRAREDAARLLRISGGQLVAEVLKTETITYNIRNLHPEPITAYVKTPRRPDWKLNKLPSGTVETPSSLYVPAQVAAEDATEVTIDWTHALQRRVAVDTTLGMDVLRVHLDSGKLPETAANQLKQVIALQRELQSAQSEIKRLRERHAELEADQKRVRENLNVLRKTQGNTALQSELANKLAQQELELGKLSAALVRASETEATLRKQLTATIQSVNL